MASRTIESPGVEINELDLSLRASLPVGTNIFVPGFAAQGPTNELFNVTSVTELEQTFGLPRNAAERYFYHTCRQVLNSPANLLVTRLPYGPSAGIGYSGGYSALYFPIIAVNDTSTGASTSAINALSSTFASTYSACTGQFIIGAPVKVALTRNDYLNLEAGITWSNAPFNSDTIANLSTAITGCNAGFIVCNELQTTVNDSFEGYYIGITDNTGFNTDAYDSIIDARAVTTGSTYVSLPTANLSFDLSGSNSVSEILERSPGFSFDNNSDYNDDIILGLFKLRADINGSNPEDLTVVTQETFYGSFDYSKIIAGAGSPRTDYIASKVNDGSTFLKVFVNPNFSQFGGWSTNGTRTAKVRVRHSNGTAAYNVDSLFSIGNYSPVAGSASVKKTGDIVSKLDTVLQLANNTEITPIDIVCEAGLGTLFACASTADSDVFNEMTSYSTAASALANQTTGMTSSFASNYLTIWNLFNNFCKYDRKDCMFIADPLRHIFVDGLDNKTLNDTSKSFSLNVYWALKNLYAAADSNYAATYGNWVKKFDKTSNQYVWLPMSGFVAEIMARVSAQYQPWWAPAGPNYGGLSNVVDLAITPNQKQSDLLYRINVNPVKFVPGVGYAVWGQKTLQSKPSALDRINVRRLFLTLEKATLALAKFFIMEPNTIFTRTRMVNTLKPIFDTAKNTQGVYDYMIVCDEKNNTANVIDNNELIVDIYLKPVRTAEFIRINFIATSTSQDFSELIG